MTIRMPKAPDLPEETPAWKQPRERLHPLNHNASVILICPDDDRRSLFEKALEAQHAVIENKLVFYPDYEQVAAVAEMNCDAFVPDSRSAFSGGTAVKQILTYVGNGPKLGP